MSGAGGRSSVRLDDDGLASGLLPHLLSALKPQGKRG